MKISWKDAFIYGLLFGAIITYINFNGELTPGKIIFGIITGLIWAVIFKFLFEKSFTFYARKVGGKLLRQINIEIKKDEKLIKEGGANHFKGWEAVGGKLVLTDKRLIFKSHKFNIQRHEQTFPLEQIKGLKEGTSLKTFKNVLMVELTNNEIHKFIVEVDAPPEWIKEIERQKASP